MKEVALQFVHRKHGLIGGHVGVLDGWVVKLLTRGRSRVSF
jgi:hypothetical protein